MRSLSLRWELLGGVQSQRQHSRGGMCNFDHVPVAWTGMILGAAYAYGYVLNYYTAWYNQVNGAGAAGAAAVLRCSTHHVVIVPGA